MSAHPPYRLGKAATALAIFAALLGSTAPSPLYPLYIARFELSHAMGTTIFATYAVGTLVALQLSSWLGGRGMDLRRFLLPGLLLTAVGALIFACAGSVEMLLTGRFLNGFGTGAITGMGSSALFRLHAPDRRGLAGTLATLAFTGGAAGGPLLSSAALALGWGPTVLPFVVIIALAALSALGLARADWPAPAGRAVPGDRVPARGTVRPLYWLACLGVITAWMLGSTLMALGSDIAMTLYGIALPGVAGLVPALFQLFAGVGQAIWGRARGLWPMLAGLVAIGALQLALVALTGSGRGWVILLAMPLCGLAYGAVFVGALGLAQASAAPDRQAVLIARFYIVGYIANAIPAVAIGALTDRLGLAPAFEVFSLTLVGVAVISTLVALSCERRGEMQTI